MNNALMSACIFLFMAACASSYEDHPRANYDYPASESTKDTNQTSNSKGTNQATNSSEILPELGNLEPEECRAKAQEEFKQFGEARITVDGRYVIDEYAIRSGDVDGSTIITEHPEDQLEDSLSIMEHNENVMTKYRFCLATKKWFDVPVD